MSGTHVGTVVPVGNGRAEIVGCFGGGPPDPGYYIHGSFRGVRSSEGLGPYPTVADAMRAFIVESAAESDAYVDWCFVVPSGPQVFQPVVALKEDRIRVARSARVDSFVKLEGGDGLVIGEHVHIASFCHLGIGGGLTLLEDGSSFGSGAKVVSGSNVAGLGHGCSAIAPDAIVKRSFVHIKKNATLYAGAIVLPGVTVGENAVLAAGAVANRDIPDREMWAGIPAKFVRHV